MRRGVGNSESRLEAIAALRQAAHAVVASQDFSSAAEAVLRLTKGAVAAEAAELSFRLRAEPELVVQADGPLESIDDALSPALRSLRREACRARRPVTANGMATDRSESTRGAVVLDSVLFAPVLVAGECMGVITLANAEGGFSDQDKDVVWAFAELMAVAWRTHQAVGREVRRSGQQSAVARLGRLALGEGTMDELLEEAAVMLAGEMDVELVGMFQLDGETLSLRAGVGWTTGLLGSATVSAAGDSMVGLALRRVEPVMVDDLRADSRFSTPHLWLEHGAASGMSVMVGEPRARFGVITVHTRDARRFTHDDVAFLQAIANVVGESAARRRSEQARRLEVARHAEAVSAAVVEASLNFLESRSISSMAKLLVEHAVRLIGANLGLLGTVSKGELHVHGLSTQAWAAVGDGRRREAESALERDGEFSMPIGQSLLSAPIREGTVVMTNKANRDPRWRGCLPQGHPPIDSYLGVPLRMGGRVVGVLALANKPGGFDTLDSAGLETFAACASMALRD